MVIYLQEQKFPTIMERKSEETKDSAPFREDVRGHVEVIFQSESY